MTTEEDFQDALDLHPDDWQTRLVFADWLQDRDDQRAEGYRALGALRVAPMPCSPTSVRFFYGDSSRETRDEYASCLLPGDWFDALFVTHGECVNGTTRKFHWVWITGRQVSEDAAATAFAKLPASRRAELLALAPVLA